LRNKIITYVLDHALHATITMALKLKRFRITPSMVNLMKDDMTMILELCMFASNIGKQICDVLDGFFSFLTKYEKKRADIMLFLMLDQRF
jgi:hypothetical protein